MIGLDVSDRSIKVIDISEGSRRKIRTACWAPLGPNLMRRGIIENPAGVAQGISDAFKRCSGSTIAGGRAVVSIPETQSFVRAITLPEMSSNELDEAVQWAIRQHIPFDLERVYLDWQPITSLAEVPTEGQRQELLVGAAQKDVVDPLMEVVDSVGLQVAALELEAQAIVRSLLPLDTTGIEQVLIVDIGATSTNIIFFHRGAIRFTTSIQRGGDDLTQRLAQQMHIDPRSAAEQKAIIGTTGEQNSEVRQILVEASEQLVRQIHQVSSELTTRLNMKAGIRAILLSGGSASLPGLTDIFSNVFPSVPVQVGNPLINLEVEDAEKNPPLSPDDATHFSTAIGLALREIEYS